MYGNCFIKMAISNKITVLEIQSLKLFLSITTRQIVALTNLCYAIYTEWLNQKSNNYLKRSETEISLFLIKKV